MEKKTDTERKAWLDGLKPGDKVVIEYVSRERLGDYWDAQSTVLRRTPKRIEIRWPWGEAVGWTVNAEDGVIIGSKYRGTIRQETEKDREREERAALKRAIDTWHDALTRDSSKVSTEVMRAVVAAIGTGSAK